MPRQPEKMYLAVDCVIFGFDEKELKLLLVTRDFAPGKWSLVGDFVYLDEDIDQAARHVLEESTGLSQLYMEQLGAFGQVDRDPTGRIVSVVYYGLIKISRYDQQLTRQQNASWFAVSQLPELIYDHGHMLSLALEHLKTKLRYQPIGFELLPEKFTLPQLQALYETVLQRKLDRRNFRRKILATHLLEKLPETFANGAQRPADYYRFNSHRYAQLKAEGYSFEW